LMRVLALTFGDEHTASTKFRVIQYLPEFARLGISFDVKAAKGFKDFAILPRYDVVLLQKTLVSGRVLGKLRQGARRLVYDADDLIWLAPGKKHSFLTRFRIERRLRRIARAADLCVAANGVIAADLASRGAQTVLIPMALDGEIWQDPVKDPGLVVGWSGAPHNLVFLRAILPQLREVQCRFPEVQWLFHCGEDPRFPDFNYTHVPFEPGREHEVVRRFHVGLLPLPGDPFVRGKSPIKALQYFACRVAVVGSPVGATREIILDEENALWVREEDQWGSALGKLLSDPLLRRRLAAAGRLAFEAHYDLPRVAGRLIKALNVPVLAGEGLVTEMEN
jgi:glycosyltransferase involved in cell wall biosynthesis